MSGRWFGDALVVAVLDAFLSCGIFLYVQSARIARLKTEIDCAAANFET
jgi:hypothetical protein